MIVKVCLISELKLYPELPFSLGSCGTFIIPILLVEYESKKSMFTISLLKLEKASLRSELKTLNEQIYLAFLFQEETQESIL